MTGETDLRVLLASMEPALQPGEFVFCTIAREATADELANALAMFRESEGMTVVMKADDAIALGLIGSSPMGWITLTVHSSLDAVGLTAAVAARLTEEGISCNVVAAFHHDHLFVPIDRAGDAVAALRALSAASRPS